MLHAEANSRPDAGVGETESPPGGTTWVAGGEPGMLSEGVWRTGTGFAVDFLLGGAIWGGVQGEAVETAARAPEAAIIGRPFRAPNPARPPNEAATRTMQEMTIPEEMDCSEIAERLLDSAGTGRVLRVEPATPGSLRVLEGNRVEGNMSYHEAYTDQAYVFDPRMSGTPIPKGDWGKVMKALNPGGSVR